MDIVPIIAENVVFPTRMNDPFSDPVKEPLVHRCSSGWLDVYMDLMGQS